MSPAAMRFLERMGFDEKAFTAAIMGLAAKGYLTIEQDESKTYKLVRRKNATDKDSDLSADEKSLARTLFEDGSPLVLKNKNHEVLTRARKGVETNLHATIETTSFRTNARYLWPGIILSVLTDRRRSPDDRGFSSAGSALHVGLAYGMELWRLYAGEQRDSRMEKREDGRRAGRRTGRIPYPIQPALYCW